MHTNRLALFVIAAVLALSGRTIQAADPTGLTATVVGSSVALSWQGDGTEWLLEAGSSPGASNLAAVQLSVPTPSYTAFNVPPGLYYVRVRAVIGGVAGPATNEVAVQVGVTCRDAEFDLSSTKSGLQVDLQWGRAGGPIQGVQLEVGSSPGLSNLAIVGLPAAQSRFVGVGGPGTYYIRVRALTGCGLGTPSNEVRVDLGTAASCQATLTPFIALSSGPGVFSFNISVPQGCDWTTFTRDTSFIQPITLSGTGPGTIQYRRLSSGGGVTQVYVTTSSGRYYHNNDCC